LGRLRQYSQRPFDENLSHGTNDMLDWVVSSLNILVGQNISGSGFTSLNNPTVDPTSPALLSKGSRISSLTTPFSFTASTTAINIFWDGTNGSTILKIYRDDGTIAGPFPGNQTILGLTAATTYYFYPFFDESAQVVRFVSQVGALGTPPIAYLMPSIVLGQVQIMRGHTPLASNLAVTGIATPAGGTTTPVSVGGGGGGGGSFLGNRLL
jgi:hypothetical protein